MSANRADLHRLVDELSDEQLAEAAAALRPLQPTVPAQPQRRLSFIGAYDSGRTDTASRSADILRTELGETDPHGW